MKLLRIRANIYIVICNKSQLQIIHAKPIILCIVTKLYYIYTTTLDAMVYILQSMQTFLNIHYMV